MRRRRLWTEKLPPAELGSNATIALLERFGLEPLVALAPAHEGPEMSEALGRLARRGIRVGLWPLLLDEDGYWPSERNVDRFRGRVEEVLRFAEAAGAPVRTLAIDLEPPLEITTRMMDRDPRALAWMIRSGVGDVRPSAAFAFQSIVRSLEARGIETIAAVFAPLVLDLASGVRLFQRMMRTPLDGVGFSVISPMLYTSLLRALLPFTDAARARAILHTFARVHAQNCGPARASVSLGLVSTGKLGDETCFRDPVELLLDVEATLAAGVDDLALFSLEGILERGSPERWLVPYATAQPRAPSGPSVAAMSALVRAFVWLGSCIPAAAS